MPPVIVMRILDVVGSVPWEFRFPAELKTKTVFFFSRFSVRFIAFFYETSRVLKLERSYYTSSIRGFTKLYYGRDEALYDFTIQV